MASQIEKTNEKHTETGVEQMRLQQLIAENWLTIPFFSAHIWQVRNPTRKQVKLRSLNTDKKIPA